MEARPVRRWFLIAELGAIAVITQVLAIRLDRAGWPHHDAIFGTGHGSFLSHDESAAHQRVLDRLELWVEIETAASVLSLSALLFLLLRDEFVELKAVMVLLTGIFLAAVLFFMGLSIMDVSVEEQRKHTISMEVVGTIASACPPAAGFLGLASRRTWVRVLGGLLIVGLVVLVILGLVEKP